MSNFRYTTTAAICAVFAIGAALLTGVLPNYVDELGIVAGLAALVTVINYFARPHKMAVGKSEDIDVSLLFQRETFSVKAKTTQEIGTNLVNEAGLVNGPVLFREMFTDSHQRELLLVWQELAKRSDAVHLPTNNGDDEVANYLAHFVRAQRIKKSKMTGPNYSLGSRGKYTAKKYYMETINAA